MPGPSVRIAALFAIFSTHLSMHLFRYALSLAVLLPCLCFAQASVDPADEYFRAYLLNNEAERAEKAGDLQRALDKFQQAQVIFDGIAQNFPTWQSDMLSFRRQRLATAQANVQSKIANAPKLAPAAPVPATAPTAIVPSPAPAPAPVLVPQPATAPAPSSGDPVQDAVELLRRAMEQKSSAIQDQLTRALAAVGEGAIKLDAMTKLKDEAVRQRDDWYVKGNEQQQRADKLQKEYDDLKKTGGNKAELDKAQKALEDTKEQLAESKERQGKAEQAVQRLTSQLTESQMKLAAIEKERDELKSRPAAGEDVKKLFEEKKKLEQQLADAQKQIATLKTDVASKDAEIASLKGQLTNIQGELSALRRENTALETQVADLTVELKKITERSIDPTKNKPDDVPKLMAENQILKGIVMRQIRQQARMNEQKKLIIDEINKSENASKTLIDQVEQMAGHRATLTDEEKKLFTAPQLEAMNDVADLKGTFIASAGPSAKKGDKTKPDATPAPTRQDKDAKALDDLMEKGNKLLADGKFADAESAYQDVLRADPRSSTGLAGLAWARVQQNKLEDAEATLRKAIEFDAGNSSALYMLGVTLFRREQSQPAIEAFEKSLSLNPKNARARHYLGVITSKMGLSERAEKEFKTALSIDPGYGEADFNLAVLYATMDPPKFDVAKKHYEDAIKKGVKSEPNLEKLLNGK